MVDMEVEASHAVGQARERLCRALERLERAAGKDMRPVSSTEDGGQAEELARLREENRSLHEQLGSLRSRQEAARETRLKAIERADLVIGLLQEAVNVSASQQPALAKSNSYS